MHSPKARTWAWQCRQSCRSAMHSCSSRCCLTQPVREIMASNGSSASSSFSSDGRFLACPGRAIAAFSSLGHRLLFFFRWRGPFKGGGGAGAAGAGRGGGSARSLEGAFRFRLPAGGDGKEGGGSGRGRLEKMAATLRIQSDWSEALRRDEGEAWLSCRSPGKPTLYGSLTRRGLSTEGVPDIAASEGFVVGEVTKKSILISCPPENVSTKFLAPYTTFSRIHQKSITCLDISSGGGLGVSTSTDGTMKIWQAANGEIRRLLEGHVYDVNCCRFFPSGLVVLSGGMDAQLKIWSAEDASCVVTFKGHKGGILDAAIVDRGRNVLSCSRDGTARLWDCGKSACLGVVADCGSPVNGIAVGAADNSLNLGTPGKAPSEREVGTEGKILLLAREDKKLQGVGLQSRQPVFLFIGSDAFNCCTFLSALRSRSSIDQEHRCFRCSRTGMDLLPARVTPVLCYAGRNNRMVWVGRDLKAHLVPTPLPSAGTSSTSLGCPELHPTWS
ncbi:proteasomal ATPase-associated factor 1-like isoform X1 [Opisthocomus hoazin]|uniref:proteasomal ATPase-associated factor 1-like isoform X1 n=1 Tax=Opisthocomus hoazin TaxID=30419 RepID=UPI003F52F0C7